MSSVNSSLFDCIHNHNVLAGWLKWFPSLHPSLDSEEYSKFGPGEQQSEANICRQQLNKTFSHALPISGRNSTAREWTDGSKGHEGQAEVVEVRITMAVLR